MSQYLHDGPGYPKLLELGMYKVLWLKTTTVNMSNNINYNKYGHNEVYGQNKM